MNTKNLNKDGRIIKELEDELSVNLIPINGEWKINTFSITSEKPLKNR